VTCPITQSDGKKKKRRERKREKKFGWLEAAA
jgi:hypothetical protein